MIRRSCLLLVVDIEGFASPACDEPVQVVLRQRLYELVEHAVAPSPVEAEAVLQSRELLVFSGTLAGGAGLGLLVGRQRPSIADAMVAQRVAQRFHHADESIPSHRSTPGWHDTRRRWTAWRGGPRIPRCGQRCCERWRSPSVGRRSG